MDSTALQSTPPSGGLVRAQSPSPSGSGSIVSGQHLHAQNDLAEAGTHLPPGDDPSLSKHNSEELLPSSFGPALGAGHHSCGSCTPISRSASNPSGKASYSVHELGAPHSPSNQMRQTHSLSPTSCEERQHQSLLPYSSVDSNTSPGVHHEHSNLSISGVKHPRFRVVLVLTPCSLVVAVLVLCFAALLTSVAILIKHNAAHDCAVGRLPVMGYNTWNAYQCGINETIILENAKYMKSYGLADVGYAYINIDDCYSEKNRSASGDIVANKERFPSGMNNVTDQIHALGLKAGIYGDSGWFTCALYPGSYQNEARDAKLFQDWGFDLLKYDNCAVPFDAVIREGMVGKYTRMANAIADVSKSSGKPPLIFSLCQWGREQPWLWARRLGQSWRTTDDIQPSWDSISGIINQNSFYSWASDFYGHNDMDMLEVGNGRLTYEETKSHFTVWSFMKSPLLIGTDLSVITNETLEILKNTEIIAINQDPVIGTAITPFRWGINPDWSFNNSYPAQYWSGESENGTIFMLLNVLNEQSDMFFSLTESPWIRAGRQYSVRDLWSHTDNGTVVRNLTIHDVPAHGVVALLLRDAGEEPVGTEPPCARPEWCMSSSGDRIDL